MSDKVLNLAWTDSELVAVIYTTGHVEMYEQVHVHRLVGRSFENPRGGGGHRAIVERCQGMFCRPGSVL